MSSTHHVVARHSPPHVRKTSHKSARSLASVAPKITIKASKQAKKNEQEEIFKYEEDDMAMSFLQYCAMCEKQIIVPNSSILYCSESCRRRDVSPPLTAVPFPDLNSPYGPKRSSYLPASLPTPHLLRNARIPPLTHDGKSDLDPTEWKPAEPLLHSGTSSPTPSEKEKGEWKPKLRHRPSSEAFQYLSKFHGSSDSLTSGRRRPLLTGSRSALMRATPSLSHTPTASTSSQDSLAGTPEEFEARDTLSMPTMSTVHRTTEGMDKLALGGNKDGVEDGLSYEKKEVVGGFGMGSAKGSLKRLLGSTTAAIGAM